MITQLNSENQQQALLAGRDLMKRLQYENASAFWCWVHTSGVPHIRVNARKILFEPQAVEAWLRRRAVGAHPAPILGAAHAPKEGADHIVNTAKPTGLSPQS